MLGEVAARLDAWIVAQNVAARADGVRTLKPCRIRLLGQIALLESKTKLELNVTHDVDVYADYEHPVETEFRRLLREVNLDLDPVGNEAWMPKETIYKNLFEGEYVTMQVADADAVLLSKALKAPRKNHALIVEFLAAGASASFLELATKYHLDLEQFL
jgi:hypothetical protein